GGAPSPPSSWGQPGASAWRRFGEPGPTGAPAGPQRNPNAGWDRFGAPQAGGPQRFAAPEQGRPQPQGRFAAPYENRSPYGGGPSRPLRVAPPTIQQRQPPADNNGP